MELRQLKYFLAVADARSFVSAASSLFVSRQAISKAVAQLESELGVELFVRDSSGAFLTPAGLKFYDRVRGNVMELEQIREEMQRYGARYHQRIRLAFSIGVMPLYEATLREFQTGQENVELEYRECPDDQCQGLLLERKADLAICTTKPQDPQFQAQTLALSSYGILLRESDWLADMETVTIQDLTWLPLAGLADGHNQDLCSQHGLAMQYTGYDLYRLFTLTRQGRCAMLLPRCMLPLDLPGVRWIKLEKVQPWILYSVSLRSLENNVLYQTILDDLHARVLDRNLMEKQDEE